MNERKTHKNIFHRAYEPSWEEKLKQRKKFNSQIENSTKKFLKKKKLAQSLFFYKLISRFSPALYPENAHRETKTKKEPSKTNVVSFCFLLLLIKLFTKKKFTQRKQKKKEILLAASSLSSHTTHKHKNV